MIQVEIVTIMTRIFSLSSNKNKNKNNSLEVRQRVLIIQTHNDEVLS